MSWERVFGIHPVALALNTLLAALCGRTITDPSLNLASKVLLISYLIIVFVCAVLFEFLRTKEEK